MEDKIIETHGFGKKEFPSIEKKGGLMVIKNEPWYLITSSDNTAFDEAMKNENTAMKNQNTLGNEKQTDPCAGQEKKNTMKEIQQKQPYGCGVYSVANALFIPSFITEERIQASKKGNALYQLNKWLEEDNIPFRIDVYFFDMENTDPLRLLSTFDTTIEDNLVYCATLQVKESKNSKWHMVAARMTSKGELVIKDSYKEHTISCSLHNILDYYYQVTGLFLFDGVDNSDTKAIVYDRI